jgi:hypothetical protein
MTVQDERMHAIVETQTFAQGATRAAVSGAVLDRVIDCVAATPRRGQQALGIEGLYLHSLARAETGADDDLEVLAFVAGDDIPVFLLDICFAGEPLRLTNPERVELAETLAEIATEYRASARSKIIQFRKARDGKGD